MENNCQNYNKNNLKNDIAKENSKNSKATTFIDTVSNLKTNTLNKYEIYLKGYINNNFNDHIECSRNKVLITLISTNTKNDKLFKKISEIVITERDNVNKNGCSFKFFKHLKENHNSYIPPSIFQFVDVKEYFKSSNTYVSFFHISINTKFKNGKKRFQLIVYPHGENTSNSKYIEGKETPTGITSILFTVNKIQIIRILFHDDPKLPNRTFMDEDKLYNFVHSLVSKNKIKTNMNLLKEEASKYDEDNKDNLILSRRFNIWVKFINFIRSKNEVFNKFSLSPFY
uniref:tRNA-intron lyase n=1 Tax=Strongyloides stercoralis TaxID=6248 RepID=A0AAF5CRN5_STRER